jgi:hypothetical protein
LPARDERDERGGAGEQQPRHRRRPEARGEESERERGEAADERGRAVDGHHGAAALKSPV